MKINKLTFESNEFPVDLLNIPAPPKELFILSNNLVELLSRPRLAVVGSRSVTPYGKAVTTTLTTEVARAGVVIVSGLAIGVDGHAHRAALEAGGLTIAVLPCGLDNIYPSINHQLAGRIIEQGGALITEYPEGTRPYPSNFVARNRIVSGLSQAVLITEATEKSGTLHTARFALEQGRDVLAVPGNITSSASIGTNNLIKAGATPIVTVTDILYALDIPKLDQGVPRAPKGNSIQEQILLDLLSSNITDGGELLMQSNLDVSLFNQTLTMLEITGKVRPLGLNKWSL